MAGTFTVEGDDNLRVVRLALEAYSSRGETVALEDRNRALMLAAEVPWVASGGSGK